MSGFLQLETKLHVIYRERNMERTQPLSSLLPVAPPQPPTPHSLAVCKQQ